jgi:nucleoside-diphosphate-sugar epimerase
VITVLGASGFIGARLVDHLRDGGIDHRAVTRTDALPSGPLGTVIDCAGITGDFLERPLDTIDAHVSRLLDIVRGSDFDSYLYLSTTRFYRDGTASEDDEIRVDPGRASDLYDISKLAGEAVVRHLGDRGRVVRLSTVYGPGQAGTFLASVLDELAERGTVTLRTALDSARDYVHVDDVVPLLVGIACRGRRATYNVASGVNVTHAEVLAAIPGAMWDVAPGAPTVRHPVIDVDRLAAEFSVPPARVLEELRAL